MSKKPSGRQPSKQRGKKTSPRVAGRVAQPEGASVTPSKFRFDLAADLVKLKFCKEVQKRIEEIEKAGNTAVLNLGIDDVEQPQQKRSMLDEHLTQLGESVCESAKKRCTDLGKLAIAHPDKLGELLPWQWARQQIEAELWGFFKLDTPASRLRRFIRRVCGGVDSIAAGVDLWVDDEPAPEEPPPRLPRWLDSHQYRRSGLARHFSVQESGAPAAGDDARLSPEDTEDFFVIKERELKSALGNALIDAETDLFVDVESVQTPAPPAKVPEKPPQPGSTDEKAREPRGWDSRKVKIAAIRAKFPRISARGVCEKMDAEVERTKDEKLAALDRWIKATDRTKHTWVELYDDPRTYNRVRTFIYKRQPLQPDITHKASRA